MSAGSHPNICVFLGDALTRIYRVNMARLHRYHSKWCTKEWFEDFKSMGLEMPKLFVVLLDTLPVTGYRIDSDAQGAPPEGDWIPLEPANVEVSFGRCC